MMQVQDYKTNFILTLRPFLEMLEHQKSIMNQDDWTKLVNNLVSRIIRDPEQYLEQGLPPSSITAEIVKEIFQEFIHKYTSNPEEAYRWV